MHDVRMTPIVKIDESRAERIMGGRGALREAVRTKRTGELALLNGGVTLHTYKEAGHRCYSIRGSAQESLDAIIAAADRGDANLVWH